MARQAAGPRFPAAEPAKAIILIRRRLAASTALTAFSELPLVLIASRTPLGWPSASTYAVALPHIKSCRVVGQEIGDEFCPGAMESPNASAIRWCAAALSSR